VNLNDDEIAVIHKLDPFLKKLGLPYVIVGARALIFLIEPKEKRDQSFGVRPTKDIDFVVSINNWKKYESIKSELAKLGFFQKSQEPEHRFFSNDIPIDIIPYGKKIIHGGKLIWPKSGVVMETAGLSEAFEHIDYIRLKKYLVVPVASLATLIFLKIIAFQDRNFSRDLVDIGFVLKHYEDIDFSERRFDETIPTDLNYEERGAFWAGVDLKKLLKLEYLVPVHNFLDKAGDSYSDIINRILYQEKVEEEANRREQMFWLFQAFRKGFEM